jgi:hypothetical protein
MAEPQLQIERRVQRVEQALLALAGDEHDRILRILEGREDAGTQDVRRVQVRQEGEAVQGEGREGESLQTG